MTDLPPIPDAATAKAMQAELKKLTAKYYRRYETVQHWRPTERWSLLDKNVIVEQMDTIRAEMRPIEDALAQWERGQKG